jgi:hypothetical protein
MMNKLPAALVLVALAGAGAGCGANATSGSGTTAAASSSTTAVRAKAVRFSACMRTHGVADFPDPNKDNDFDYGISVSGPVWTKAVDACRQFQPPGTLSGRRTRTQQSTALRFASCMRTHGVRDFPDPVNGEPLIDTYKIPSSNRPGGMTILNAASAQCHDLLTRTLEQQR